MFTDTLTSEFKPAGGSFTWNVNPSTRPVVAGRHGRDATGPPQGPITLPNPPGVPAENTIYPPGGPTEEIPFTVKGPADGVDNGWMTVHIEWGSPDTDWDVYVIGPNGEIATQSASFGDTTEDAVLFDPPPGQYKAVVVNYDQVMNTPDDWFGGEVTLPLARPADRDGREGGVDADLHRLARPGPGEPPGGRGPRRGGARGQRLPVRSEVGNFLATRRRGCEHVFDT